MKPKARVKIAAHGFIHVRLDCFDADCFDENCDVCHLHDEPADPYTGICDMCVGEEVKPYG